MLVATFLILAFNGPRPPNKTVTPVRESFRPSLHDSQMAIVQVLSTENFFRKKFDKLAPGSYLLILRGGHDPSRRHSIMTICTRDLLLEVIIALRAKDPAPHLDTHTSLRRDAR
jgi:hypothetical protein